MFSVLEESSKYAVKISVLVFLSAVGDWNMKDVWTEFRLRINLCYDFSCSAEFGTVVNISLKAVLDALVEDMGTRSGGSLTSGMPLAKLLSLVTQMGPLLLYGPSKNRFIQIIQSDPEVEIFFTLLYANMPPS